MLAIDILEWPGMNVAFLVSFFGAIALTLVVDPDRQAATGRRTALVG